jgi:hypothetical protein
MRDPFVIDVSLALSTQQSRSTATRTIASCNGDSKDAAAAATPVPLAFSRACEQLRMDGDKFTRLALMVVRLGFWHHSVTKKTWTAHSLLPNATATSKHSATNMVSSLTSAALSHFWTLGALSIVANSTWPHQSTKHGPGMGHSLHIFTNTCGLCHRDIGDAILPVLTHLLLHTWASCCSSSRVESGR